MSNNTLTSWAETREHYTRVFEAPPGFTDETDIGALFRQHPAAILAELERAAQGFAAGKLHSPWRVVAKKLDRIAGDHDHIDITRDLRVRQAEAWIRNAGIFCTEAEVVAEVFSAVGGGKGYSGGLLCGLEGELGDHIMGLWRAEQPRAALAERAYLERAESFKAARAKVAQLAADADRVLDAEFGGPA